MTRLMPGILAMAAIVLASNILVQYPLGTWLTWGALSYPFAFLVTDLANRLKGPEAARRVVLVGFLVGLGCSFVSSQIEGEFGPLTTLRIAIGSGTAFLIGQLLDVSIFNRLRAQSWWKAPLYASLIASAVDTAIFFTIAFSGLLIPVFPGVDVGWANEATQLLGVGPVLPYWISLAVADMGVKIGLAFVALVPFRIIVGKLLTRTA